MEAWTRVDMGMEKEDIFRKYLKGEISRMDQILKLKKREVSGITSAFLDVWGSNWPLGDNLKHLERSIFQR